MAGSIGLVKSAVISELKLPHSCPWEQVARNPVLLNIITDFDREFFSKHEIKLRGAEDSSILTSLPPRGVIQALGDGDGNVFFLSRTPKERENWTALDWWAWASYRAASETDYEVFKSSEGVDTRLGIAYEMVACVTQTLIQDGLAYHSNFTEREALRKGIELAFDHSKVGVQTVSKYFDSNNNILEDMDKPKRMRKPKQPKTKTLQELREDIDPVVENKFSKDHHIEAKVLTRDHEDKNISRISDVELQHLDSTICSEDKITLPVSNQAKETGMSSFSQYLKEMESLGERRCLRRQTRATGFQDIHASTFGSDGSPIEKSAIDLSLIVPEAGTQDPASWVVPKIPVYDPENLPETPYQLEFPVRLARRRIGFLRQPPIDVNYPAAYCRVEDLKKVIATSGIGNIDCHLADVYNRPVKIEDVQMETLASSPEAITPVIQKDVKNMLEDINVFNVRSSEALRRAREPGFTERHTSVSKRQLPLQKSDKPCKTKKRVRYTSPKKARLPKSQQNISTAIPTQASSRRHSSFHGISAVPTPHKLSNVRSNHSLKFEEPSMEAEETTSDDAEDETVASVLASAIEEHRNKGLIEKTIRERQIAANKARTKLDATGDKTCQFQHFQQDIKEKLSTVEKLEIELQRAEKKAKALKKRYEEAKTEVETLNEAVRSARKVAGLPEEGTTTK